MSNNKDTSKMNDRLSNTESDSAKLAVIAGIITTLGDGLSTVAAMLELEEAQQSSVDNDSNSNRLDELEKQVQYLTKELNKLKSSRK